MIPLLLTLMMLLVALGTLGTLLFQRHRRAARKEVLDQARRKMLDHWAAQELDAPTMILDGRELARTWERMGLTSRTNR